jgi:sugar phosphate isomerase/epimerase
MAVTRRELLAVSGAAGAAVSLGGPAEAQRPKQLFRISLAQWSLHKTLFSGKLNNLDFPKTAKEDFGIPAVEYVNQFWKDKSRDRAYLTEMKKRTEDLGVRNVLIMCDDEGALGDADPAKRKTAVENHFKWVEAANFLGCHSIRVNAYSTGTFEEQQGRAADGLRQLCEFADPHKINVIVENHGGFSSNGEWLAGVMKRVDHRRAGTLPDFGNFRVDKDTEYDRYKGVSEMMPYAKGVSAKSHDFDEAGNEIHTDYRRMLQLVLSAGYSGFVGIEYEGSRLDEYAGIRATKRLLEIIRGEIAAKPGKSKAPG